MTVRNLDRLFRPRSIAVIGGSDRPGSTGAIVMRNLCEGGFAGSLLPVNPRHKTVAGLPAYRDVARLPDAPDLAVICTRAETVPSLIAELGARGTKATLVLSDGLGATKGRHGRTLRQHMLDAARPHLLRVLGPASGGILIPRLGLNASLAHTRALPGKIAFVSQSEALAGAVLDWAKSKDIGFSCCVHLGESADIDLGDVLDYLASDPETASILIYMESLGAARKFMSAARAAARNKPVVAVRAGRVSEGARLATTRAAMLVKEDDVYDAALRRAGMLRVFSTADLFDAAETLARARPLKGERLTIVSNGRGPGLMAADALLLGGGALASLSPATADKLAAHLPRERQRGNPLDIGADASAERHVAILQILLADPLSDAIVTIHAPTAAVDGEEVAAAVAQVAAQAQRNIFACWLGGDSASAARRRFDAMGVPSYDTPEKAVGVFRQIVEYHRNQELLREMPPSVPAQFAPDAARARDIVHKALRVGRNRINEHEARTVLAAYGLPVVEAPLARTRQQAAAIAEALGYPVTLKLLLADNPQSFGLGGIARELEDADEVRTAANSLRRRARQRQPAAKVKGFSVHQTTPKPKALELFIGVATDPVFGPVIVFGEGGTAAEAVTDRAVALPPLNMTLARDLISRTRVAKRLVGGAGRAAADQDAICLALVQVSQLIADIDEIAEIEIDPLLVDEHGVLVTEARMRVVPGAARGFERFAIRPYPAELEEEITWQGRPLLLRPIRPEDEIAHGEFLGSLKPEDIRLRFFSTMREMPRSQLARFTQIDYDREMAFVAVAGDGSDSAETLGEVRAVADPDNCCAEFAIVVRSELKGKRLGTLLLKKMIDYCRSRGTAELRGETLVGNDRMLALAKDFSFARHLPSDGDAVELRLGLQSDHPARVPLNRLTSASPK